MCELPDRSAVTVHTSLFDRDQLLTDDLAQEQYDALPEKLRMRELAVGDKVVVTTLLSPQEAPGKQLKALYGKR